MAAHGNAAEPVNLTGTLTYKKVKKLKKQLSEILSGRETRIEIKLQDVEDVDFFGLQLLCSAHRTARGIGKSLIFNPPPINNVLASAARYAGFLYSPDPETEGIALTIRIDEKAEQDFRKEFLKVVTDLENMLTPLISEVNRVIGNYDVQPDQLDLKRGRDTGLQIGIFRALHTLKEVGGMFGFAETSLALGLEKLFSTVMDGKIPISDELIGLMLASKNYLEKVIAEEKSGVDTHSQYRTLPAEKENIIIDIERMIGKTMGRDRLSTYRLEITPVADTRKEQEIDLLSMLQKLWEAGLCTITPDISRIPSLDKIDPELCYVDWVVILKSPLEESVIREIFIFLQGDSIRIESVEDEPKMLGEILVAEGMIEPDQLEEALKKQQTQKVTKSEASDTLRVSALKVDMIIDMMGELFTMQSRFLQMGISCGKAELINQAEDFGRIISTLRENVMEMRLIPIGSLFGKFRRVVRDLSDSLNKKVELTVEGEDTGLDKTVIEQLDGPLVHIIRNCVDHGIEMPDIRESLGKRRTGQIHLHAFQAGSQVIIEIKDDGQGLNKERIRQKGIERNLISENQELSYSEIYRLIFVPGFSTAQKVSDISGRGVGMDVVKQNIVSLRGSVTVDSEEGKGTTITLSIPLTLAIIEGLLVKVLDRYFVIPLSLVETCSEIRLDEFKKSEEYWITHEGKAISYLFLKDRFGIRGESLQNSRVVIVKLGSKNVGLVVDQIIGQHQTVIKPLGYLGDISGLAGATILGDGSIAMILDIPKLIEGIKN